MAKSSEIKAIPNRKGKNRWKEKAETDGNDKKMTTTEARTNLSDVRERAQQERSEVGASHTGAMSERALPGRMTGHR